jgi:hypothetical protein
MRKEKTSGNYGALDSILRTGRLLTDLHANVQKRLPPSWSVEHGTWPVVFSDRLLTVGRPDAWLKIGAPDGTSQTVIVEIKKRLEPRLIPLIVDQLNHYREAQDGLASLVTAQYLSPRTRELLTDQGIGYFDATGNLRLVLDRPAVYIETVGALSDPWPPHSDHKLRSLKGPIAGRVVRALCDLRPPYGVQELAERSGTSLASVSRVCTFLDLEALIVRGKRGLVVDVKWPELIRRWTSDYSFAKTNTPQTFLEPRGLPALLAKLRDTTGPYSVTGSLAAAGVAPIAAPRLAAIYVTDIERVAEDLRLRLADAGANVILAEPFDTVVFDRRTQRDEIYYAAYSQVAADLLTSPGRGPSEGEELIRWMEAHEDAWRA